MAEDVTATVQVTPKESREARITAAIAKGKEAAGVTPEASPAPADAPSAPPAAGAPVAPKKPPADAPGAQPAAAAPPEAAEAPDDPDPPEVAAGADPSKAEPKTKRAKEWAAIERKQAEVAQREREARRAHEEAQKLKADLFEVQKNLAELDRLRREDPKAFVESFGPDGVRKLFEAAVSQEKRSPEEIERAELKRELTELKAKLGQRETAEQEAARRAKEAEAARSESSWHAENQRKTMDLVKTLVADGGYPNVARHSARYIAADVYSRVLRAWNGGKGPELPISVVLDGIEKELAAEAGSVPAKPEPPERANGADETAKPAAKKRAPPSLTNAQAAAQQSAAKELRGKDRLAHFAKKIQRVN